MEEIAEYIPLVGDFYRSFKMGFNIGQWILGNNRDEIGEQLISEFNIMASFKPDMDRLVILQDVTECLERLTKIIPKCSKKYQLVICVHLWAKSSHILGIITYELSPNNLERLKEADSYYKEALRYYKKVFEVEKSIFTEHRSLIDTIRKISTENIGYVKQMRRQLAKQYRVVDKKMHPWKYRLPGIILLLIFVLAICGIIVNILSEMNILHL